MKLGTNIQYVNGREYKHRGVFFKPGFTGLTASKPEYPGLRLCQSGGPPVVPTVSGHLSEVDSREREQWTVSYTAAGS